MQQYKLDKLAETPDANKMQCLICKRWYRCVCTHAAQRHGVPGDEYKKFFGLPVGKGINPPDLAQKYHEIGKSNDRGISNLKKGAKYRYKKL